mmetsp:Transcript_11768/g.17156  ORF Transcript_11768/g.17156 Transcript_11768/m.17156 type:complete len:684 (+) Transcript_11768:66-2117(+)
MGTTASKDEADLDDVNFTPQVEKNERRSRDLTPMKKGNASGFQGPDGPDHNRINSIGDSDEKTEHTSTSSHDGMNDDTGKRNAPVPTSVRSYPVPDDMVQVNLAMADLMAYLQVVANNSANLPLTRRDDPELGRTVSTLTADEYAMKSAAFIPSSVRIIGGSFLKYGRVWDLPTSEEFKPSDGAQEPGVSHGGACCNAFLKVLYDAENETNDFAQNDLMNPANLFNDDESTLAGNTVTSSKSFETLTDMTLNTTITWAELLRKMKAEIRGNGFAQVPTITTSRKFDLNKPFSLFPPTFNTKVHKKRSLLIGCNYGESKHESLKACHDDIRSMKDYIVNVHGFPEAKGLMTVLLDDGSHTPPTHQNIIEAFKTLSEQTQPGDAVFVQFSGHGGRLLDSAVNGGTDTYDEVIIPSDFSKCGVIRDTLIFKTLLAPMRSGVTVTFFVDCCDTGMMLDLPYSWTTRNDRLESAAKMSLNDDFSFVRFLKVVKTLYESSKFTQLGNTVGSVLKAKGPNNTHDNTREINDRDDDSIADDSIAVGSLMTVDDNDDETKMTRESNTRGNRGGFYSLLASCTTPSGEVANKSGNMDKRRDFNDADSSTIDTKPKTQNLFQQVLNCTLNAPAEDSDDDETFNPAHNEYEDDHTFDGASLDQSLSLGDASTYMTCESATDVSLEKPRGRSRYRR